MINSAPSLNRPRTGWSCSPRSNTSWKHGELVPIRCFMVNPGDTFDIKLNSLIRMNTPKQAFADDLEFTVDAFYVPMRLVWQHTEEFFGANKTTSGAGSYTAYTIPKVALTQQGVTWDSVSHYLGKPVVASSAVTGDKVSASILKERGYWLIWNTYYRAAMLQPPVLVQTGDLGTIATGKTTASTLAQVNKNVDYITCALQSPIYGGVGASFDILGTGFGAMNLYMYNNSASTVATDSVHKLFQTTLNPLSEGQVYAIDDNGTLTFDLYAKPTSGSVLGTASIDSVRYALALEAFLHNGNYGNSYWSLMLSHYGISPADKSLQLPQMLGTIRFDLNVAQVTTMAATVDQSTGADVPAGSTAAISVTGNSEHLFKKAFDEFGFVYVLCYTKVKKQSYGQGLKREDFLFNSLEFFSPEFNNLPDDKLYKKEVYFDPTGATNEQVFGYQEHDAYLKYFLNESTGILTPGVSGVTDDTWTFTNNFNSPQQLNAAFLTEKRDLVASKLLSGTLSNYDYLGFFQLDMKVAREVSLHADPRKLL